MDVNSWGLNDILALSQDALRLGLAAALGGLVGLEREWVGKAAGLRTHALVSLGAALFVMVAVEGGAGPDGLTRVIQGVATGVGFVGAGTILKRQQPAEVSGLTTAAGLWLTGAIGIAIGLGESALAVLGVLSAWAVLWILAAVDRWVARRRRA